jgi:hypothetical protein
MTADRGECLKKATPKDPEATDMSGERLRWPCLSQP